MSLELEQAEFIKQKANKGHRFLNASLLDSQPLQATSCRLQARPEMLLWREKAPVSTQKGRWKCMKVGKKEKALPGPKSSWKKEQEVLSLHPCFISSANPGEQRLAVAGPTWQSVSKSKQNSFGPESCWKSEYLVIYAPPSRRGMQWIYNAAARSTDVLRERDTNCLHI